MKHQMLWSLLTLLAPLVGGAQEMKLDPRILEAEKKRIATIEKVRPSVVAIFGKGGQGGGSGVLIDEEGYALTNFHVVSGSGPVMKCGLPDGILYDGVLVGLDKVGDVALIKLLPKKEGDKFPFAKMGDSDTVRAGDWSLAMGNPFLLATDFTPTVTYGLISGVHRYQYPAGTLLEYTDCIQIDTSINPGNSGGPLFNMEGDLIGINGRGSFEKRGRVNSGVGYAISINQIKNFLLMMRAGMDTDHASLGAAIETKTEESGLAKLVVNSILPESDAFRRGMDIDDELLGFGKVQRLASVNEFKNILGIYPRGWRVPVSFRRKSERRQTLVRLMGIQRRAVSGPSEEEPQPGAPPRPGAPKPPEVKHPMYQPKPGFANYYFNEVERKRLMKEFAKHGDFSGLKGEWSIACNGTVGGDTAVANFWIKERGSQDGKNDRVWGVVKGLDYSIVPLDPSITPARFLTDPPGSGGLMVALYHLRQLLVYQDKGFVGHFDHGGMEPWYIPGPAGETPDYDKQRVYCEVIRTRHANVSGKWYFSMPGGLGGAPPNSSDEKNKYMLLGCELVVDTEGEPIEVYFLDHQNVDGRMLPRKMIVMFKNNVYARFDDVKFSFKN